MSSADLAGFVQQVLIFALPLVFGITVHEVAHGWVARQFGDPTAERLGRLTLNPIKHVDPIGTILVPLVLIYSVGMAFGWAKPVPVNVAALRNPKRDMVAVAAAGPAANLAMALGWTLVYFAAKDVFPAGSQTAFVLVLMARFGIFINLLLMLFNLLPIPPLDGGRILRGLVPAAAANVLDQLERYGLIIVFGLIWLQVIAPVVVVTRAVMRWLGVPPL